MSPLLVTTSSSRPYTLIKGQTLTIQASGTTPITISGAITGEGSVQITGGGIVVFKSTNNSYTGTTTILNGMLQADCDNAFSPNSYVVFGNISPTTHMNLDPPKTVLHLDLNGHNNTVAGLFGGETFYTTTPTAVTASQSYDSSNPFSIKPQSQTLQSPWIRASGLTPCLSVEALASLGLNVGIIGKVIVNAATLTITRGTQQTEFPDCYQFYGQVEITTGSVTGNGFLSTYRPFRNNFLRGATTGPVYTQTITTSSNKDYFIDSGVALIVDTTAGDLVLNGCITLQGDLEIKGPNSVIFTNLHSTGCGFISIMAGSTLIVDTTPGNITWGGILMQYGTLDIRGNNRLNLSSGVITSANALTLIEKGATLVISLPPLPIGTPRTVVIPSLAGTITGEGSIEITTELPTVFTGSNKNYSGLTTILAGTLQAGSANAFSPNSVIVLSSTKPTTLDLNNFDNTIAGLVSTNAPSTATKIGTVNLDGGATLTIVKGTAQTTQPTQDLFYGITEGTGTITVSNGGSFNTGD